jgi:hypothetical protein
VPRPARNASRVPRPAPNATREPPNAPGYITILSHYIQHQSQSITNTYPAPLIPIIIQNTTLILLNQNISHPFFPIQSKLNQRPTQNPAKTTLPTTLYPRTG